jgi:hypothetical protein
MHHRCMLLHVPHQTKPKFNGYAGCRLSTSPFTLSICACHQLPQATHQPACCSAWCACFAALLQADKDLYASLFSAVGAALTAAPDCVPVPVLACLAEAQLLVNDKMGGQAPKLPVQVSRGQGGAGAVLVSVCILLWKAAGGLLHVSVLPLWLPFCLMWPAA